MNESLVAAAEIKFNVFLFQMIFSELNELMSNGQWLIIRYSDASWQSIKQICSRLTDESLNENFRLWIIIEETHTFPLDVLRMSFKGKFIPIVFLFHSRTFDADLNYMLKLSAKGLTVSKSTCEKRLRNWIHRNHSIYANRAIRYYTSSGFFMPSFK